MSFDIVDDIPVMILPAARTQHHLEHYNIDALEFDYFESRDPATDHDERRVRESILRRLHPHTTNVLDVGCGRAWVAQALCQRNIFVCSLDASITNPKRALQTYASEYHTAVVADAMCLPFADSSFDCIIASEIIEHLPNPHGFVQELLRVLRSGGQLLISTPYKEKLRYVLCIHCNQRTPLHAHLHSFDEYSLQSLSNESNCNATWQIFGNKGLLLLRTYVLLRYLPYQLWRSVDAIANLIINKPAHIVIEWSKAK